jgi:hypothetical protein
VGNEVDVTEENHLERFKKTMKNLSQDTHSTLKHSSENESVVSGKPGNYLSVPYTCMGVHLVSILRVGQISFKIIWFSRCHHIARESPAFQRNKSLPSQTSKSKPHKPAEAGAMSPETTHCYNSEDRILHGHHHKNLIFRSSSVTGLSQANMDILAQRQGPFTSATKTKWNVYQKWF